MTATIMDPVTSLILDFISEYESTGNYDAVIGESHATASLSALTLDGIYSLQGQLVAAGRPSTAIGRYQIIKATLLALQAQLKLAGTERFTPELQDRLGVALLVKRGYSAWWRGQIDDAEFAHRLSLEWAALPDPQAGGKSHYDGVGANHAGTTLAAVYAMLMQARALIPTIDPPNPAPPPPAVDAARVKEISQEMQALAAELAAISARMA